VDQAHHASSQRLTITPAVCSSAIPTASPRVVIDDFSDQATNQALAHVTETEADAYRAW
jgi:hypothetical protein